MKRAAEEKLGCNTSWGASKDEILSLASLASLIISILAIKITDVFEPTGER